MIETSSIIAARPRKRDSLLFVYGTLRPFAAVPLSSWLAGVARHLGHARTRGRLYDLGEYPGLVPARRNDEWVEGEVYEVSRRSVFRVLDRYEAGPAGRGRARFARVRRTVRLRQPGGHVRRAAWLYLYRQPLPLRCARIARGDYRIFRARISFEQSRMH